MNWTIFHQWFDRKLELQVILNVFFIFVFQTITWKFHAGLKVETFQYEYKNHSLTITYFIAMLQTPDQTIPGSSQIYIPHTVRDKYWYGQKKDTWRTSGENIWSLDKLLSFWKGNQTFFRYQVTLFSTTDSTYQNIPCSRNAMQMYTLF